MTRLVIAYVFTALVFVTLDGGFLTLVGPHLYRLDLNALLGDKVRLAPAALFYLVYVAGLVFFCVRPGLTGGWRAALIDGAVLGLVAYGTYDLTCQAVMRVWSWRVTLADMAWGVVASSTASAISVLLTGALSGRIGGGA
jgi:uncharacterized membrane protein